MGNSDHGATYTYSASPKQSNPESAPGLQAKQRKHLNVSPFRWVVVWCKGLRMPWNFAVVLFLLPPDTAKEMQGEGEGGGEPFFFCLIECIHCLPLLIKMLSCGFVGRLTFQN